MNKKLNIFDFFSYLIPGSVYLLAILLFLLEWNEKIINIMISPTPYNFTIGTAIAFVLGRVGGDKLYRLNPFYKYYMSAKIKELGNETANKLKDIFLDSSLSIKKEFVTVEFAERYIVHKGDNLIDAPERQMALRIFSRNISAAFIFLGFMILIKLCFVFSVLHLIFAIFLLILSFIFLLLVEKYAKLYFRLIIDSILVIIVKEQK